MPSGLITASGLHFSVKKPAERQGEKRDPDEQNEKGRRGRQWTLTRNTKRNHSEGLALTGRIRWRPTRVFQKNAAEFRGSGKRRAKMRHAEMIR